jgi:hypothetical protein
MREVDVLAAFHFVMIRGYLEGRSLLQVPLRALLLFLRDLLRWRRRLCRLPVGSVSGFLSCMESIDCK